MTFLLIWGDSFSNKKVFFRSDNLAVVQLINKQSSKNDMIVGLIRRFATIAMELNILYESEYLNLGKKMCLLTCCHSVPVEGMKFRDLVSEADL